MSRRPPPSPSPPGWISLSCWPKGIWNISQGSELHKDLGTKPPLPTKTVARLKICRGNSRDAGVGTGAPSPGSQNRQTSSWPQVFLYVQVVACGGKNSHPQFFRPTKAVWGTLSPSILHFLRCSTEHEINPTSPGYSLSSEDKLKYLMRGF